MAFASRIRDSIDNAHDVVIRYMRFRRGSTDIYDRHGGHYGSPIGNIILDHLLRSWGNDQNLDTYRHMYQPPEVGRRRSSPRCNVTIQWCITSEALNTWNHAFGGDWGGRNTGFPSQSLRLQHRPKSQHRDDV